VKEGLGGIYHAKAEHPNCKIFKTLMSNTCIFDCKYCGNTCSKKKAEYEPKEVATLFKHLHEKLDVNGLFLTSGINKDPDSMTQKMIEAVRIIRNEHKFEGYVHFKVLPGTSYELIKQASELATRMSINIEAPNKSIMSELSDCKEYKTDILRRQAWISRLNLWSGQTTQMVVNRFSSDKDVLKMTKWEYNVLNLKRVYYSAFRPVQGTKLEGEKAEPISRQNHLYNVDFLVRSYGYDFKEFEMIMEDGMLPNSDPKLEIARKEFEKPLDVNSAGYEELIRVPGIGPKTAQKIVEARRRSTRGESGGRKIRSFADLDLIGCSVHRAKPFISIDGKRQATLVEY